jgi:hypothetical protein
MPGFMDTFFFLSLGIAFVLILLLVYHFKQRLTANETKCDTMFEIVNGLASEVNAMKGAVISSQQQLTQIRGGMASIPVPQGHMFSNMSQVEQTQQEVEEIESDDEILDEETDEDSDSDSDSESEGEEKEGLELVGTQMMIQLDNADSKIVVSDDEEDEEKNEENTLQTQSVDFAKMNVANLKTYVTEKGLVEDAKKMKKTEILELLKNTEESA